jgi:hypothetical protein
MGTLGICAIIKNECDYIIEWLAYHRVMGIRNFYIADNDSDDGSSELLMSLHHAGLIERVYFPTVEGQAPQLPSYRKLLSHCGNKVDFLAIIDADEFIVPTANNRITAVVERLGSLPDVGAIGVNWCVYGSSGKRKKEDGLVIKRFKYHSRMMEGVNRHIKSIVKTSCIEGFITPHRCSLMRGKYINTQGEELVFNKKLRGGLTEKVNWNELRINHYVVKSWEEFKEKKQPRGRASTQLIRNDSFFEQHDLNHIKSSDMDKIVADVTKEITKIGKTLREKSNYYSRINGAICNAKGYAVSGWAVDLESDDPVDVRVLINRNKEYVVKANGKCNSSNNKKKLWFIKEYNRDYRIRLEEPLRPGDKIYCQGFGNKYEFNNSPYIVKR